MKTVTMKVWVDTKRLIKLISAMTDESMLEVVHRLAIAEWERLNEASERPSQSEGDK